jgi:predicted tellurium resistance membrane protein TerC
MYFLLAGVVHRFVYLKPTLAIILSFIGATAVWCLPWSPEQSSPLLQIRPL